MKELGEGEGEGTFFSSLVTMRTLVADGSMTYEHKIIEETVTTTDLSVCVFLRNFLAFIFVLFISKRFLLIFYCLVK